MPLTVEVTVREVHVSTHVAAFAYTERRGEFATRVADSAGRVFDSLFGPRVRETIFLHLAVGREVSKWDIVDKPGLFLEGLHGIFGDAARSLEVALVVELRREFGLETPESRESLVDVVIRASQSLS